LIYCEGIKCDDESIDCIDVQMIGRFIHDEYVRVIPYGHGECYSALLSSGE
jgi:hypothetical protein